MSLKEIYLNLSSRVVLSNRTTYIISPFGLLLQEANQLPATRIDLRRVCSTNNHQSGFLTKRASLQASSAAEIPPESHRNSRNSRNPILAHGVHTSDLKARPIWRQISVHILQNEQLQQTHSVPNHRRNNTSWRTRRNTISRRNNNNGQAVYRHRFTWSRTCLKAFRALPDQKGMKPSCLKKYIWIWVAA